MKHNLSKGSWLRQYENTGCCCNQDAASKINLTNIFSHAMDAEVLVLCFDEYPAKIKNIHSLNKLNIIYIIY